MMSDEPSKQTVVEFLHRVDASGRAQLEMEFDLEVADEADAPKLRFADDIELEELAGRSVQIRLPTSTEATGWVADAELKGDGTVHLGRIRRLGSDEGSLEHSRSDYRVAIPPSSVAALTRLENGETVSVEPVDISRGGIGLRADADLAFAAGEPVEVDLNIIGEFAGTLSGQIAFARAGDGEQVRVGVAFEELEPAVADALRRALNNILLGTTQQIT